MRWFRQISADFAESKTATCSSLAVEQKIVLYRSELESGRGNFRVRGIKAHLHGIGYANGRIGDRCPFFLDSLVDYNYLCMNIRVYQIIDGVPIGAGILRNIDLWANALDFSESIDVDLEETLYPRSFLLASPDNGGQGITVIFSLKTAVGTHNRDGFAEINFSEAETGGLALGCIEFHGEYLG